MKPLDLLWEVLQKALLKYSTKKIISLRVFARKKLAKVPSSLAVKSQQEWHEVAKLKSFLSRMALQSWVDTVNPFGSAVVYQSFRIIWLSLQSRPALTKCYSIVITLRISSSRRVCTHVAIFSSRTTENPQQQKEKFSSETLFLLSGVENLFERETRDWVNRQRLKGLGK